jgi:hypothetical protein
MQIAWAGISHALDWVLYPSDLPCSSSLASCLPCLPQGLGLVKVGFFDLPLLITSVSLVKDFLLVGDVAKGACFIRYNVRSGGQLLVQFH